MAQSESAMGHLIEQFQADHLITSEEHPIAAKIASAMALFGFVCVTRKLYKHSKTFAKYCFHAKQPLSSVTLTARYGGGQNSDGTPKEQAWAMVLNSADQLGNAYAQQLASLGFDLILCGPPIDQERMQGQATILEQQHNVRTSVITFDYQLNTEESYQEVGQILSEYDICILVNNQTYTVPFDIARKDLQDQSIETCVAQINKHINCSLMIQQLIVPKMLTRHEQRNEIRSAILTLKTHANALFEQQVGETLKFPILRCAMAFNQNLSRALHDQYNSQGIDVMQAFAPYIAFESWLRRGLILEALMQERMLAAHVRSILNHMRMGYAESAGSWESAIQLSDGNQMLRMRLMVSNTGNPLISVNFLQRYADMVEERRQHEVFRLEALKTNEEEESKSHDVSTDDNRADEQELFRSAVQVCDQIVQTSEANLRSFREMAEANSSLVTEEFEEVKEPEPMQRMVTMQDMSFEEDSFTIEPADGDQLDFHNERRVRMAEMSANSKLVLEATKQSQDMLLKKATQGKEELVMEMTELQFENFDVEEQAPVNGESMEIFNEKRVFEAEMSQNKKALLAATSQTSQKRIQEIVEKTDKAKEQEEVVMEKSKVVQLVPVETPVEQDQLQDLQKKQQIVHEKVQRQQREQEQEQVQEQVQEQELEQVEELKQIQEQRQEEVAVKETEQVPSLALPANQPIEPVHEKQQFRKMDRNEQEVMASPHEFSYRSSGLSIEQNNQARTTLSATADQPIPFEYAQSVSQTVIQEQEEQVQEQQIEEDITQRDQNEVAAPMELDGDQGELLTDRAPVPAKPMNYAVEEKEHEDETPRIVESSSSNVVKEVSRAVPQLEAKPESPQQTKIAPFVEYSAKEDTSVMQSIHETPRAEMAITKLDLEHNSQNKPVEPENLTDRHLTSKSPEAQAMAAELAARQENSDGLTPRIRDSSGSRIDKEVASAPATDYSPKLTNMAKMDKEEIRTVVLDQSINVTPRAENTSSNLEQDDSPNDQMEFTQTAEPDQLQQMTAAAHISTIPSNESSNTSIVTVERVQSSNSEKEMEEVKSTAKTPAERTSTPHVEISSDQQPEPVKQISPTSKTLKTETSLEALHEKVTKPPASEVGKNANEEGKKELVEQKIVAEQMSLAPTEETNDTNTAQQNQDLNSAPKFKPYNRLSQERARSQSESKSEVSDPSGGEVDKPDQENEAQDEDEAIVEVNQDQENISVESPIVYPEERQDQANDAKDSSNPFQPELLPILDSAPIVSQLPETNDELSNYQTPAFTEDKTMAIPAVSSGTESKEQSNQGDDNSTSPPRQDKKIEGNSRSPIRGRSTLIKVAVSPQIDRRSLSKSQISDHSQGVKSEKMSISGNEWKTTELKEVVIQNVKLNSNHSSQKSFEAHLAAHRNSDQSNSKNSVQLSQNQGVSIQMNTIEDEAIEETKEKLEQDSDIYQESSSPSMSPEPRVNLNTTNDMEDTDEAKNRLPQKQQSDLSLCTPRSDDLSSAADMNELKMALGGLSERSTGKSNNLVFKQGSDQLEMNDVIFSDEGSNDSFNIEEDLNERDKIWNSEVIDNKASLQFMRSTTLKMAKGDETDQAIQKVLQNLVNNFLTELQQDKAENNENLNAEQKLEKRNQHLIYELATCLPFVKLAPGRYLVGTEIRQIQIKGRGVLVRTGGGYMYLSEFLLHYAKSECLKLGLMILKQNKTYKDVVLGLLKRQANSQSGQKEWIKKCPKQMDDQFAKLVTEVRSIEVTMQKRRSTKMNKSTNLNKSKNSNLNLSMRSSDSGGRNSQPMYIQSSQAPMGQTARTTRKTHSGTFNAQSPQKLTSQRLSATMVNKQNSKSPILIAPSPPKQPGASGYPSQRQSAGSANKLGMSGFGSNRSGKKQTLFKPVRSSKMTTQVSNDDSQLAQPLKKKKKGVKKSVSPMTRQNIPVSDLDEMQQQQQQIQFLQDRTRTE